MKKYQILFWVGLINLLILSCLPSQAIAAVAPPAMVVPPYLSLAQIKVTGEEFLIIQNNTGSDIADLSYYWLEVFNNVNPMAAGVSNSSQQLPATSLVAGGTLLLSVEPRPTCGATVAGKLSISLTDSGGHLQIVKVSQDSRGMISYASEDMVSWSSGASGVIPSWPSSTKAPRAVYYRYQKTQDSYDWQRADLNAINPCQLQVTSLINPTPQPVAAPQWRQSETSPPATMVYDSAPNSTVNLPKISPASIGLMAPQISELLPNPSGTGTDDTKEFVELYNPNSKPFDLGGFVLQTGVKNFHNYTFPTGTIIPPKSFKVFSSAATNLTLSNTESQAVLLDPFGKIISYSATYQKAKDGHTWAIMNGKWYWTIQPTPGAANIINQPQVKAKGAASSVNKIKAVGPRPRGVRGAVTSVSNGDGSNGSFAATDTKPTTSIHPTSLALVASLALLYGAYEYRHDLANKIHQLRRNRAPGRANR